MFKIKNWELCVFTLLTVFIIRKNGRCYFLPFCSFKNSSNVSSGTLADIPPKPLQQYAPESEAYFKHSLISIPKLRQARKQPAKLSPAPVESTTSTLYAF